MSSGIICKIKLDPFLQDFLRGYYNCKNFVFKFPREDFDELRLAVKFNNLLDTPPSDYKYKDFGECTFNIEVPYQDDKDPVYYCYISQTANDKLAKKIFQAYRDDFYDQIREMRSKGWTEYKDIVELYIDKRKLNAGSFDRLIKDYQRWRKIKNNKKYQQKLHRLSQVDCLAS